MFWVGMLVMYLIVGILMALVETFANGFLDEWFFYLFTWWIMILCLPFAFIIKKVKKIKKTIDK